jgi:hypothetical protein
MRRKIAVNNINNRVMLRNIIFAVALEEPITPPTLRTNPPRFKIPNTPPIIIPSGSFFHSKKADTAATGKMIIRLFLITPFRISIVSLF